MTAGGYALVMMIDIAIPAALFVVLVTFGMWLGNFMWYSKEFENALSK